MCMLTSRALAVIAKRKERQSYVDINMVLALSLRDRLPNLKCRGRFREEVKKILKAAFAATIAVTILVKKSSTVYVSIVLYVGILVSILS
mmetsp:Transcript_19476/g.30932  ORF Transcript_19476/g.30932 Transcript_19476/m.30932 type:complete len:90 (+) Transcript_19476:89-358(+)